MSCETRENLFDILASTGDVAPVEGTMLDGLTNTGLLFSLPRVNRVTGLKLRSTDPGWLKFAEYVASTLAEKRLPRMGPFH